MRGASWPTRRGLPRDTHGGGLTVCPQAPPQPHARGNRPPRRGDRPGCYAGGDLTGGGGSDRRAGSSWVRAAAAASETRTRQVSDRGFGRRARRRRAARSEVDQRSSRTRSTPRRGDGDCAALPGSAGSAPSTRRAAPGNPAPPFDFERRATAAPAGVAAPFAP